MAGTMMDSTTSLRPRVAFGGWEPIAESRPDCAQIYRAHNVYVSCWAGILLSVRSVIVEYGADEVDKLLIGRSLPNCDAQLGPQV